MFWGTLARRLLHDRVWPFASADQHRRTRLLLTRTTRQDTVGLSTCHSTGFDWISFDECGLGLHTNVSTRYPGCYLTRPVTA